MARYTYGPEVKARVKRLLEALLSFVNRDFDESKFDIEFKWEAEDSSNPKLKVKTTLVVLEWLTAKDNYSGKLTKPQIREALKLLDKDNEKGLLKILEDNRTKTQGVNTWHFTLTLWSKDKEKNLQQFEQAWEDSRPDKSKKLEAAFKKAPLTPQFWGEQNQTTSVLPPNPPNFGGGIDWHNICRAMLEKQKRLTTNELLSADEDMKFELDDIHVPLALVQRTKPDKRSGDVFPEEGSRLLQPTYEEKQRFRHEEFLAQILQEGKGQSKGRRIAVIGEPGAGKTTLLQSIAFWLFEDKNKNLGLPIWISLADLQGKTLEEYLLQRWLKNVLAVVRVTPEQENALVELFKKERVWLFLDGVDEIAGGSVGAIHELPLQMVASQLEGWVAKARVVLSCRLNVWEANINVLGDDFETYRLLDFDYPLQVKEFICRWFRKTDADKGERLWAELDKSERQRIQDLVKNPLRLALLCSTWQSSDKGLPSTKAGLYQRFVEVFYTWKKNRFRTTFEQRQELNAALGRLALRAIDSEVSRFRLRHKVVCEVLGDPEQEGSLFGLALQLGWLNKVGLAAESETQEKVYAFFHPTFQEYFAALAIDDWHYFLNHFPLNPGKGTYRIFDSDWREVILLWIGNIEGKTGKEQKNSFIQEAIKFIKFPERVSKFYLSQICSLVEDCLEEFSCEFKNEFLGYCSYFHIYQNYLEKIEFLDSITYKKLGGSEGILNVIYSTINFDDTDIKEVIHQLLQSIIEITLNTRNKKLPKYAPDELGFVDLWKKDREDIFGEIVSEMIIALLKKEKFSLELSNLVIGTLKQYMSDYDYYPNIAIRRAERFCFGIIMHCAQNMTYPAFYQAWHQLEEVEKTTTSNSQNLNQANLPQSLQSAIANDPQLSQMIHLICIDGSQFIEPDRPAAEIYDQMLDQNCPECDSVPETMPALKLYWNSLKRNSNKHPVLVFYTSSTNPYSEAFLTVLSKFGREMCVITEQRFDHIPPKFFAPSQTIEDVVKWIREKVMEE